MGKLPSQFKSAEDHSLLSSDGTSELFLRFYGPVNPRLHFLLVHGALEYSGRHQDLVSYLLRNFGEDVAITTWDLVGHGRSGGLRAYVPDFRVYVEDMQKIGSFVQSKNNDRTRNFILAHSLGGLITLTRILDSSFGWTFPLHGLILSSPCIRPQNLFGQTAEVILEKLNQLSGKFHLPIIYKGKDLTHDPERANDFDSNALIPNFITAKMAIEILEASHRIRGLSYYLNVPSLFLIAGDDKVVNPESTVLFAHGIDKRLAQTIHYPKHFHELWNEIDRWDIFETMKNWIDKKLKECV